MNVDTRTMECLEHADAVGGYGYESLELFRERKRGSVVTRRQYACLGRVEMTARGLDSAGCLACEDVAAALLWVRTHAQHVVKVAAASTSS